MAIELSDFHNGHEAEFILGTIIPWMNKTQEALDDLMSRVESLEEDVPELKTQAGLLQDKVRVRAATPKRSTRKKTTKGG